MYDSVKINMAMFAQVPSHECMFGGSMERQYIQTCTLLVTAVFVVSGPITV